MHRRSARLAAAFLVVSAVLHGPSAIDSGMAESADTLEVLSGRLTTTRDEKDPRPNIVVVLADDWSYPHAAIYGDSMVYTPNFDRLAGEGILFDNAFCASPSCTPSRVSMLTGQYPHRLGVGANHMVKLPKDWPVYPELLEQAGYFVGKSNKGCAPGSIAGTKWKHDPAGRNFVSFYGFVDSIPAGKPFCFWVGSKEPHRPYGGGLGVRSGMQLDSLRVPGFLPDIRNVRKDILDYYFAVQKFDRVLGNVIETLGAKGLLDNTIIVVTSDNGMPFPRGKGTCYDSGTRVPLAVKWPRKIKPGQRSEAFVNLSDLAPTFLEAAGLDPPEEMTGRSLLPLLTGERPRPGNFFQRLYARLFGPKPAKRDKVFVERERHALGRGRKPGGVKGILSYPIRGVRTKEYLYLRNLRSHLWPACDPPDYKDVDYSPTKMEYLYLKEDLESGMPSYYQLAFGIRPAEELFDVINDPFQLNNLADDPQYEKIKKELRAELDRWMAETDDPRAKGEDDRWDYCGWYEGDMPPYIPRRPGASSEEEGTAGD